MEGFNYEIKFENSPFEIGNNLTKERGIANDWIYMWNRNNCM